MGAVPKHVVLVGMMGVGKSTIAMARAMGERGHDVRVTVPVVAPLV